MQATNGSLTLSTSRKAPPQQKKRFDDTELERAISLLHDKENKMDSLNLRETAPEKQAAVSKLSLCSLNRSSDSGVLDSFATTVNNNAPSQEQHVELFNQWVETLR